MTLRTLAAALSVLAISAHATAEAGDKFLQSHARGLAANQYHGFSIRFKDGQTVFQASPQRAHRITVLP